MVKKTIAKKSVEPTKVVGLDYVPNFSHLQKLNHIDSNQASAVPLFFLEDINGVVPKLWIKPSSRIINKEYNDFLVINPKVRDEYERLLNEAHTYTNTHDFSNIDKQIETTIEFADYFITNIGRYLVKGWENIRDAENVDVPFTYENFISLYNAIGNPEYRGRIVGIILRHAGEEENFILMNPELRTIVDLNEAGKKS